jgi:hypothetical protein
MRQAQIIRSNTFHRALAVAGLFAIFVIVLFGFIYLQTDKYLIARSDQMISSQLNVIAALPGQRQLDAIDEHIRQDSRGVHYAALFAADGRKIAGNLEKPTEFKINDSVQNLSVVRVLMSGPQTRVIRAIAQRTPNGDWT